MSFNFLHADKSTQHQVILQARSAAPLMRMEGVFWQGVSSFCCSSQQNCFPLDVPMFTIVRQDRLEVKTHSCISQSTNI